MPFISPATLTTPSHKHRAWRTARGVAGLGFAVSALFFGPLFFPSQSSANAKSAQAVAPANKLAWGQLTPAQQNILAPLAGEWDKLPEIRQKKWLQITARYPNLKPEEQQRLQSRMAEWAKMTPEQRRTARENFQVNKNVSTTKKAEAWQDYQKLPNEQKSRLADAEKAQKKPTAVSALPSANPKLSKEANNIVRHDKKAKPEAPKTASGTRTPAIAPGAATASAVK